MARQYQPERLRNCEECAEINGQDLNVRINSFQQEVLMQQA